MKIECVKEKLYENLSLTDKITGKNLTLPVLSCVLIEAVGKKAFLRATNLDLGIEVQLPVKVEREGKVAVPVSVLVSFVSGLGSERMLVLESKEANLQVTSDRNTTLIKCQNADDFPTIPVVSSDHVFRIEAAALVKGLRSVWYAAAVSSMKPELSSVYIYLDDDYLVFAATDSFRLAEKKIKIARKVDFGSILIPFKNVAEVIRVLETATGEVEVHLTKNQIAFSFDGVYLTSRVIEGAFPDYRQIIPKEFKSEAVVLKQDLVQALRVANVFSDTFNQVNIKTDSKRKVLELRTKNNDVGENVNSLEASLTGEPLEMNFNFKYIVDSLPSIEADSLTLSWSGPSRPMVVRGVGDAGFTYLVMPMNR